jgi:hypothetical protein
MKKIILLISMAFISISSFSYDFSDESSMTTGFSLVSWLSLAISVVLLIMFIYMAVNIAKIKNHLTQNSLDDFWLLIAMGEKQKARLLLYEIIRQEFKLIGKNNVVHFNTDGSLAKYSTEQLNERVKSFFNKYQNAMQFCDINLDMEIFIKNMN